MWARVLQEVRKTYDCTKCVCGEGGTNLPVLLQGLYEKKDPSPGQWPWPTLQEGISRIVKEYIERDTRLEEKESTQRKKSMGGFVIEPNECRPPPLHRTWLVCLFVSVLKQSSFLRLGREAIEEKMSGVQPTPDE